jgi:hypothetical protein
MRKWFGKLDNPFLLIAEGFIAGAILFWSTSPGSPESPTAPAAHAQTIVSPIAHL